MFAAASGELHVGDADVWCVEGNMTRVLECLIDYLGGIQVGGEYCMYLSNGSVDNTMR